MYIEFLSNDFLFLSILRCTEMSFHCPMSCMTLNKEICCCSCPCSSVPRVFFFLFFPWMLLRLFFISIIFNIFVLGALLWFSLCVPHLLFVEVLGFTPIWRIVNCYFLKHTLPFVRCISCVLHHFILL